MNSQFHHYIPRFILKRFSSNDKHIKTYEIRNKTVNHRKIAKIYGVKNMYKDISNKHDPMALEASLSVLESRAGEIIKQFCDKDTILLTRKQLIEFKRFLFVMAYRRNEQRCQYMNDTFDAYTRKLITDHMNYHHITIIQDVWFRNLKWLVSTDIPSIVDEHNRFGRYFTFSPEAMINSIELKNFMIYQMFYVSLWEADEGSEFIISDNSFGCFEGVPACHYLFVLSPTRMLVLTHRDGELVKKYSHFSTIVHDPPKVRYKNKPPQPDPSDRFIYSKVRLRKEDVYIVNGILLECASEYITYRSDASLYHSIVFYENNLDKFGSAIGTKRDYSALKKRLNSSAIFPRAGMA